MQIDINVKTYSTKQRILAFFMAFMIFSLTCPELFEGLGVGLIVHAAVGDGNIHSATVNKTSIYTSRMNDNKAVTGNSAYTYTGKYTNDNTTTLFDYISDYELRSGGAYNTCQQNEDNYVDVYKTLNKAISDNYVSSDKIQIIFEPADSYKNENVHIYFFGGSGTPYAWPGPKMSYDTGNGVFYYTAKYTDLNSPTKFIINDGNNSAKWQTEDLIGLQAGKEITVTQIQSDKILIRFQSADTSHQKLLATFRKGSSWTSAVQDMYKDSNNEYIFDLTSWDEKPTNVTIKKEGDWTTPEIALEDMRPGLTYYLTHKEWNPGIQRVNLAKIISVTTTSKNYYDTQYTTPLYFGTFLMDPAGTSYPTNYTDNNRPVYNNFYWQANMGLKPASAEYNGVSNRGTAVVKNLVKGTLSGDPANNSAGNLLDVNSPAYNAEHPENQIQLPYFDKSSSLFTKGLMRYYDTDTDGGHLTFPFYEVYKDATTSGEYERYYQFDSREANLQFNFGNINDAGDHTGYFSESNVDISKGYWSGSDYIANTIKPDRSNVGFFPFNSTANGETGTTNNHNLGFGLKFQMDFQLEDDGCVSAMKKNATTGALEPKDGASRIPTIFEFTGDDDLWVFIDGNLVLDMGGDHNKAYGKIDFYNKKVTVEKETEFGTDGNNNLGASVTPNATQLTESTFISKLSGTNFTGTNADKYDTTKTHTLTVFYMERGMMDSNLSIRYNYSPIANTSRMKVAEVTKFTGVNSGLLDLTKQAAEDDVFKYTISNTLPSGITAETPLDSGAKYPVTAEHIRTAESDERKIKLTPNGSGTAAEYKFTVGSTNVQTYVKNTSYWWVDGFSDTDYMAGRTTNESGTSGQPNYKPGGDFWLMYGTNDSVYDSTNTGKESSAEFEKQFTKGSKMTIVQGDNIYRADRTVPSGETYPSLYDASTGAIKAVEQDGEDGRPSRAVDDYYTTKYRLVDRAFNTIFNETSEVYKNSETGGRNATFDFNNASTVSEHLATMLTEYVENTVRTGTLTIKNTIINKTSADETFSYTIHLYNVFGATGNDVSSYSSVLAEKSMYNSSSTGAGILRDARRTTSTAAAAANVMDNTEQEGVSLGTFTLKDGEQLVITGVPVGTAYSVTETGKDGVTTTVNVNSTGAVSEYTGGSSHSKAVPNQLVEFVNNRQSDLTVEKQDENGNGLGNAEFSLYYKESVNPATFLMNNPWSVPDQKIEKKIPEKSGITVPAPETVTGTKQVITKSYTYKDEENPPTASDSEWILPRNDSDYIYFRDYNTNSSALGEHDKKAFASNIANNPQSPQIGNRAWRYSWLKTDEGHSQNLEIGFGDEDKGAWISAQFTKNGGQNMVEYSVWERFVDKYDDVDTVVWKIQPPDGYNEVRFCLYYGGQCIRTTERFPFELGKIYHKTNWGKYYSKENNIDCYWEVPVKVEENGTKNYWAPEDTAPYDNRMTGAIPNTNPSRNYTGTMTQARKYEPTDQKVIFHCNSDVVWHNIHIQFFDSSNQPINGQPFPGYMMEPYAYGGSDYRVGKYLTYELTIPKDAVSFSINNGVADTDTYGYYTARTTLRTATSDNGDYANVKNYGNYYKLSSPSTSKGSELTTWGDGPEGLPKATYESKDVESDYDYIYFEKPSGWKDHVYAYFYGGGDLRKDNWQRACYSAWPGVEAAGTEYKDNGTQYYSTTYTYSVTGSENEYNGTGNAGNISPETTFKNSNGKTIYKFRVPKGDRKNYNKVIFNDGLSSQGGKYETSVIAYNPGYLYKSDGSRTQYYTVDSTSTFTARDSDSYIYVKMNNDTYKVWDNLHITFYDNNGRQIHQGGDGYIMDYSGTKDNYKYFKIAIPNDAARFKLNNGQVGNKQTDYYEILRKGTNSENNTCTDYTKDKLVYTLNYSNNATTVTRTAPTFTEGSTVSNETISGTQKDFVDYTTRGDKIHILDDAPWNIGIGNGRIKFYKSNGALITATNSTNKKGDGTYTLIQSKPDANGKKWYTIDIPQDAVSFTLTTSKGTTSAYEIYPYSSDGSGVSGSYTSDGMYYHTMNDGSLALIESTVKATSATTTINDETYPKRSDYLYLVTSDKSSWDGMTVTFYGADGSALYSGITAKYINDKDGDSWYKVSIPADATSFTVTKGSNTTPEAEIYPLRNSYTRYKDGYTLGDMQYRLETSPVSADLIYPVFTLEDEYTLSSGGQTINSSVAGLPQVDASAVSGYASSNVGKTPTIAASAVPDTDTPVLYNTVTVDSSSVNYNQTAGDSEVTKRWSEGSTTITFVNNLGWNASNTGDIKVHLWDGELSNSVDVSLTKSSTPNGDGYYTWSADIGSYKAGKAIFYLNGWTNQTANITLANYGYGQTFTPLLSGGGTYIYVLTNKNWTTMNQSSQAKFSNATNFDGGSDFDEEYDGQGRGRKFVVSGTPSSVYLKGPNDLTPSSTNSLTLNSGNNYGKGKVYLVKINSSNQAYLDYYGEYDPRKGNNKSQAECAVSGGGSGNGGTYVATYQIEDRYGFVSDINGTSDTDNFIYVDTTNNTSYKPYVVFYPNLNGGGTAIQGQKAGSSPVEYSPIQMESVNATLYRIRLPKNAKSFKMVNGKDGNVNTATAINLEEDVSVTTASGDTVTVENFRHAGTTFVLNNSGAVASKTLRSGFTPAKDAMADPLNPKTDKDFVYFTDTGDFASPDGADADEDGKAVYAYFYGEKDGEFMPWPGVKATTANTGFADTTYTDNNGNTVYMFRIPQGTEGSYDRVIFTNGLGNVTEGQTTTNNIKITQSQPLTGGANYSLSSAGQIYGEFAPSGKVYAVTAGTKTTAATQDYDGERTIYIINNGTPNTVTAEDEEITVNRAQLDEMHVIFYKEDGSTVVGNANGYKPDKVVGEQYERDKNTSYDVYKITVPDDAVYFQITNGTAKGSEGGRERHSEIKQISDKGLYTFIEPEKVTSGADNIDNYVHGEFDGATLSNNTYLLDLVNPRLAEDDDPPPSTPSGGIKLATVVTDDTAGINKGKQNYIKWLKQVANPDFDSAKEVSESNPQFIVDTEYLNHTNADINPTGASEAVLSRQSRSSNQAAHTTGKKKKPLKVMKLSMR